jgi:hypothetical protein
VPEHGRCQTYVRVAAQPRRSRSQATGRKPRGLDAERNEWLFASVSSAWNPLWNRHGLFPVRLGHTVRLAMLFVLAGGPGQRDVLMVRRSTRATAALASSGSPAAVATSQPAAASAAVRETSTRRAASLRGREARSAQVARQPEAAAERTAPRGSIRSVVTCLGARSAVSPLTVCRCPVEKLR